MKSMKPRHKGMADDFAMGNVPRERHSHKRDEMLMLDVNFTGRLSSMGTHETKPETKEKPSVIQP